MQNLRVLLVDDNQYFLDTIEKYFLSVGKNITIVGKAYTGKEALRKYREVNPDLLLMDLAMPEMGGLEATRIIKQESRSPRVVIITIYENEEYRRAAQEFGADDFLSKIDFYETLMPCMQKLFPDVLRDEIHAAEKTSVS